MDNPTASENSLRRGSQAVANGQYHNFVEQGVQFGGLSPGQTTENADLGGDGMIWRSTVAFLAAILVSMVCLSSATLAQRTDAWELLGATRIGGSGFDLDEIDVGKRRGRFEKIRLRARSNNVFIRALKVVFNNGESQDVRLGARLREGAQTAPIDLAGAERFIKRIEIAARTRGRRAVVEVYGVPAPEWVLIGSRNVRGYGMSLSTFLVPSGKGPFTSVRVQVERQDLYILGLRVAYKNGKAQDFRVRNTIRKGRSTRPFELSGFKRGIEHIEVVYRARPGSRKRSRIEVYGEKEPPKPKWEELGCQKVGFFADRDIIRVGRKEGKFSAIQLRVSGATVYVQDLKVVYERGSPDNIRVRAQIRAGGETRPLDLRGERRAIDRIELSYGSKPSTRGQPAVCVYGHH
jgi:hypothetical protein